MATDAQRASKFEENFPSPATLQQQDSLAKLVRYFEESESTTSEARKLSERDRDYYDNKQWTADEEATLKKRKQPVVTYNRIQRKVDFLSGLERQQRKDPKAFPRNPDDEDAANAATDAIRYVCDSENWDEKRSAAWDNILIEGTAAVLIDVKPVRRRGALLASTAMTQGQAVQYDPQITQISWDRFFYDPKAAQTNFADARYMGIVTWYDYDVAVRKWPDGKDALASSLGSVTATDTYEDKPKFKTWAEPRSRRVLVCEIYHLEGGVWQRCVFTKGGYLEGPKPSPYLDEEGEPENPIKAVSLYIDRDNNRYGSVRILISPQDEINKRRSKALHRTTMRQARVSPAAGQDGEKIRRELAKPDGIVTAEKDDFEILPSGDLLSAEIQLLQEAKNEIDLLGANAALAGKNEADLSGRAILAQQQGGMVEVARAFDRLRWLSLEVYRAIWNRIRQVWTNERWIRVTDDERNLRFVGLNQQVTVNQIAQEVQQGKPEGIQSAIKLVGPQVMQAYMQGDPRAQTMLGLFVQQHGNEVVETRNAINDLDIDIIIDEGMDTPTVQAEQFDQLMKLMPGMFPQGMPPPVMELLIEASSLRDKKKLLQILEKAQTAPPPDPMVEQAKQLQLAQGAAEVRKTDSETAKNLADAQNAGPEPTDPAEHMLRAQEVATEQYNAVTDRMQALKPEPQRQAA